MLVRQVVLNDILIESEITSVKESLNGSWMLPIRSRNEQCMLGPQRRMPIVVVNLD
jgi:hypothetical protein